MLNLETRPPSSARRGMSRTADLRAEAQLKSLGLLPVASRSGQGKAETVPATRPQRPAVYQRTEAEEPEYDTDEDEALHRSVVPSRRRVQMDPNRARPRRYTTDKDEQIAPSRPSKKWSWWLLLLGVLLLVIGLFTAQIWLVLCGLLLALGAIIWLWGGNRKSQQPPRPRRRWHPLVWVGVTLLGVLLLWQATTSGASLLATHLSDPGTYGETGGNSIFAVLGGGDSSTSPTKILALNNDGRVELLIIVANDPAKAHLWTGPDLATLGFPDPQQAVVNVQAGDFQHSGKTDLQVTVYADQFDRPLHRINVVFYLYNDGQGHFTPQQP
jgi:hypothetical protein